MEKPIIKIVNCETGEEIEREFNADELKTYNAFLKKEQQELEDMQAKAISKSALLEKLGITAEEAALLLS